LIEAFLKVLREHQLFTPGEHVLVAVSGGADSVALLSLLHLCRERFPLQLSVAHFDHAIRVESNEDAEFVAGLCRHWNIPFFSQREDVPALVLSGGGNLEEVARLVRRRFLLTTAEVEGCSSIALGHHRGDQVETMLHRLIRGSGLSGMAGMALRDPPFVRPLLFFSREIILDYLRQEGLGWREDATNQDCSYTRNRIRHQLLPLLEEFNPRIEERLASFSRLVGREEDFWQQLVDRTLAEIRRVENEELRLGREPLLALHPALRLRVLRAALGEVRGDLRGLEAIHLDAVASLLLSERPQAELKLPGCWVARRYQWLVLRQQAPLLPAPFCREISGPGPVELPDGRRLHFEIVTGPGVESSHCVEFAAACAEFPLTVRTVRPGDRFVPDGMRGHKKVKDYFVDTKVERETRRRQLALVGPEILWLVGMRRSALGRPEAGCQAILRVILEEL